MFERFTQKARDVVVGAQQEASERGDTEIRGEHLLASLVRKPDTLAQMVLTGFGITPEQVLADLAGDAGPSDAEALASIGIDLDAVRRQVEEAFGPGALDRGPKGRKSGFFGHIPFHRTAKKTLELSLREAIALGHNYIGTEHVLLGLLRDDGRASRVLTARGMRLTPARIIVEELVRGKRAG